MRITNIIIALAVFLLAFSASAGDLEVDNLTVSKDATIYGKLDIYSVAGSSSTNVVSASGGIITTNGNYRIHTFTNNGSFQATGSITCEVLIVAGGGGGGGNFSGGGGGGGVIMMTSMVSGSTTVTIGAGGAGSTTYNTPSYSGGNSVFGTNTAIGGGRGGVWANYGPGNGGSGGGGKADGAGEGTAWPCGTGTVNQGHNGGVGYGSYNNSKYAGGGGGGADGEGGAADISGNAKGGNGGEGYVSDISGTSTTYGSGGGGGAGGQGGNADIDYGVGGTGAGDGGCINPDGTIQRYPSNGTGYGCGGGGGGWNVSTPTATAYGGAGYQGIVIIKYLISANYVSTNFDSILTISSNGINQANTSGSNVFMGKMGIGTDNPAEQLHVVGNVRVDGTNIVAAMTLGGEARTNWPSVAVGALMASNNLSEISSEADKTAARANLGLGSAATNEANLFLTPTSDGSQLTNITAAQIGALSTNAGALLSANNLSELTAAASAARNNLGLGSAATNVSSAFELAGAANAVSNALSAHTAASNNPHQVTAAQAGALSVTGGVVNGSLSVSSDLSQVNASGTNVLMGKVGIGTNNPAEQLHVVGNVRVDGTNIVSAMTLGGEARTNWPSSAAGALSASNNLSDISDKASARSNLGLGTAATNNTDVFELAGAANAVSNALSAHTAASNNPHQVTAAQVGALTPTGDGSQLTGITAAQVGALSVTGGMVNGSLSVASNLFVNGTNVADLIGSGAFNSMNTNLDMSTNRIVNLAAPVDPNDAASKYYLWTSLSNIPPIGDLSMGIYTNY